MSQNRTVALLKCPFALCKARPDVVRHKYNSRYMNGWKSVILMHMLENDRVPGQHACPASLMTLPLDVAQLSNLAKQLPVFLRLMPESEAEEASRAILDVIEHGNERRGGPTGGEGRPRIPENDPAWQRGGRADEDIIPSPQDPQEGIMERRPLGVSGADNRGGSMASSAIETAIAYVNGARLTEDNAKGVMRQALTDLQSSTAGAMAELENSKASLAAANEIGNSQRLNAAYIGINAAVDKLKEMLGMVNNALQEMESAVNASQQQQDEWIAIVTSA